MAFSEHDALFFWEPELGLEGSRFFDTTLLLSREDLGARSGGQSMANYNTEESSVSWFDGLLDWQTSWYYGVGWIDPAANDSYAMLQATDSPSWTEGLPADRSMNRIPGVSINQQMSASTPASSRSTAASSVDIQAANNKNFTFPKDLRRHQLTHSNSKPHRCPVRGCRYQSQGFSRKDNCLRHVSRAHPEVVSASNQPASFGASSLSACEDVRWGWDLCTSTQE
ncbi:hypothetical protein BST61_g3092 [Cercospora zeina]